MEGRTNVAAMIGPRKYILTMLGNLCRKHRILKIEHSRRRLRLTEISPNPSQNIIATLSEHYRNITVT